MVYITCPQHRDSFSLKKRRLFHAVWKRSVLILRLFIFIVCLTPREREARNRNDGSTEQQWYSLRHSFPQNYTETSSPRVTRPVTRGELEYLVSTIRETEISFRLPCCTQVCMHFNLTSIMAEWRRSCKSTISLILSNKRRVFSLAPYNNVRNKNASKIMFFIKRIFVISFRRVTRA